MQFSFNTLFLFPFSALCVNATPFPSSLVQRSSPSVVPRVLGRGTCPRHPTHPWKCDENNKIKSDVVGISQDLLDTFRLAAQFSAAAYCMENNNSTGSEVTCAAMEGGCPDVEKHRTTTLWEFQNEGKADDTGFIAYDYERNLLVLSFRGSISKANWHYVWKSKHKRYPLCAGCKVHSGFQQAWNMMRTGILNKVQNFSQSNPQLNYRVMVTGHSFGGALATFAAAEIRTLSPELMNITDLYTFGSPRVGDHEAAVFWTKQSPYNYRITATNDWVPRLGPYYFNWEHISPEYWMPENPDNPDPATIHKIGGYHNTAGISGQGKKSKKAHGHYFGPISSCITKGEDKSRSRDM